jgi:DICT domain-containing protein
LKKHNKLYRFRIASVANPGLTTAQLAERTGLNAATLRMWESRHGFPVPARLPSGHRRYSDRDVESVLEVLALRRQGLSLTAAIARSERSPRPPLASVFAGLRQRRPEVAPAVLTKPVVLALSHAIEDEYCAQAASGVLIAGFQRERFYRGAQRRWRELARTAELAVALADFERLCEPRDAPVEVPITRHHALSREWALVVAAPGANACLAAWEQPTDAELSDDDRRFEVLWSFEPQVVRTAVEVATELLATLAPAVAARIPPPDDDTATTPAAELRFAAALSQRMVRYLGASQSSGTSQSSGARAL